MIEHIYKRACVGLSYKYKIFHVYLHVGTFAVLGVAEVVEMP